MTQEERNTNKLQWELRIQTFQDSGLTQQQWCEKEGVKLSALRYWLRHFREEKSQEAAPDWLKVCVSDTDPILWRYRRYRRPLRTLYCRYVFISTI